MSGMREQAATLLKAHQQPAFTRSLVYGGPKRDCVLHGSRCKCFSWSAIGNEAAVAIAERSHVSAALGIRSRRRPPKAA